MMFFIKQLLATILLLCVGLACSFSAQKPMHLTLKEAILLSLRYNPAVLGAEVQRVVDKFNLAVAKNQFEFQYALTGFASQTNSVVSGGPPTISGSDTLTPVITRETTYGTQYSVSFLNPVTYFKTDGGAWSRYYNPALTLTVTQPLIQGSGKEVTMAPLFQNINNYEISKLNFKLSIITNVTQITLDYWNVLGSENALEVNRNALKVSEKTVVQNDAQIKLGFMAPSENVQARAAVAAQKIAVASSENQVYQAKLALLRDMGLSPTTVFDIDHHVSIDKLTYATGPKAERLLLTNNQSYQIALLNLKNAKLSLLLAEDQQRWSLNLVGTFTQGNGFGSGPNGGIPSLYNGFNRSRNLALTLNVPIDNLSIQQVYVQSKTSFTQQELAVQLLKLNLVTQLLSNQENLRILRLQVDLAKQSIELSYKSYQDALKKVLYGQSTMFEVTTLQTNYINASLQYIVAEISFLNALASYNQSLGITLDIWKIKLVY